MIDFTMVDISKVKLVIWDWYRTLSNRHLYEELKKNNPGAYEIIQNHFLENPDDIERWSNGNMGFEEIHEEFSKMTSIPKDVFDLSLHTLAGKFDVDDKVLKYVKLFDKRGLKQVIAADNFDVWDEFFLPQYSEHLNIYFSQIYSSAKFRIVKKIDAQKFIDHIISSEYVGVEDVLLIDDNKDFCEMISLRGGQAISHDNFSDLARKLQDISRE